MTCGVASIYFKTQFRNQDTENIFKEKHTQQAFCYIFQAPSEAALKNMVAQYKWVTVLC